MGVKEKDEVLVISDVAKLTVGKAFTIACRALGAETAHRRYSILRGRPAPYACRGRVLGHIALLVDHLAAGFSQNASVSAPQN